MKNLLKEKWMRVFVIITSPLLTVFSAIAQQDTLSKHDLLAIEVSHAESITKNPETAQDEIDAWLRVASMALNAGEPEYARQVLINVTSRFESVMTEKNFSKSERAALQTLGGKEEKKYFLGDPYEQMMAYLYLGILDFQAGDFEKARVSFKNASIVDGGSGSEKFRSDFYLAFLLEGIASIQLNDKSQAEDSFRFAKEAFAFRLRMPEIQRFLGTAVNKVFAETQDKSIRKQQKRRQLLDAAYQFLLESVPLSGFQENNFSQIMAQVSAVAREKAKSPPKNLKVSGKEFLDTVDRILAKLSEQEFGDLEQAITEQTKSFNALVDTCYSKDTNVFWIHQIGWGPTRRRFGQYGEILKFCSYPERYKKLIITLRSLGNIPISYWLLPDNFGESIVWQANTRGGREMDYILGNRAVYRQSLTNVSTVSANIGAQILSTTPYTMSSGNFRSNDAMAANAAVALAFLVGSLIVEAAAQSMHPEADIRTWHELPARLIFGCLTLSPGEYELRVSGLDSMGMRVESIEECNRFIVESGSPTLLLSGDYWR